MNQKLYAYCDPGEVALYMEENEKWYYLSSYSDKHWHDTPVWVSCERPNISDIFPLETLKYIEKQPN